MIFDASIVRNFALMDMLEVLAPVARSRIRMVHGVLALPEEDSDLGRIRNALMREAMKEQSGAGRHGRCLAAVANLDSLHSGRKDCEVLMPSLAAQKHAVELHEANPERRRELGVKRRRLSLSDSLTITVALEYEEAVATDDEDAARAYLAQGGKQHLWTRDLLDLAIESRLVAVDLAKRQYTMLVEEESFFAPAWDDR